jgi:hypothetical protein
MNILPQFITRIVFGEEDKHETPNEKINAAHLVHERNNPGGIFSHESDILVTRFKKLNYNLCVAQSL